MNRAATSAIIVIFGLVDGIIHGYLDLAIFHGNILGNLLPTLFLLDGAGWIVLIAAFLLGSGSGIRVRRSIDVVMILYVLVEIGAWFSKGDPNPLGLAYVAKPIEVVLIAGLIYHAVLLGSEEPPRMVSVTR